MYAYMRIHIYICTYVHMYMLTRSTLDNLQLFTTGLHQAVNFSDFSHMRIASLSTHRIRTSYRNPEQDADFLALPGLLLLCHARRGSSASPRYRRRWSTFLTAWAFIGCTTSTWANEELDGTVPRTTNPKHPGTSTMRCQGARTCYLRFFGPEILF